MANPYYGDIGDAWNHPPLLELMRIDSPRFYWESHAGSARYPLLRSWQRDYGVFRFLEHASRLPRLRASRYHAVLRGLTAADGFPRSSPLRSAANAATVPRL